MKPIRLAAIVPLALAAACATTPEPNAALESARTSYRLAAAHPEVPLRAPGELQVAERSLAQAERLAAGGADRALVSHQAYLADQRARIAMATADYRKAEAQVATSGEQRNRVLLEARTRQVEQLQYEKQAREAQQPVARPTERGLVFTLSSDLLFDSGQAVLKPGGEKTLENITQAVGQQPGQKVIIEGFTDSTGSAELNRRLSDERAQAVKAALVARGVDPQRIDARGYGQAYPVASNDTSVGRQLNRRVQVVIATNLR